MEKNVIAICFFEKGKECGFMGKSDFAQELAALKREYPNLAERLDLTNSFFMGLRYGQSLRKRELFIRYEQEYRNQKECA